MDPEYQAHESARTGIPSAEGGFNNVFGYYIEVTTRMGQRSPRIYIRKQTLKKAERYHHPRVEGVRGPCPGGR